MRPAPMPLGPFIGGMNTYSDPSAIADNELVDCLNMELDIDGSLVCRPVVRKAQQTGITWTKRLKVIGQGVWTTPNKQVLFGSNSQGLWYLDNPTGAWQKIAGANVEMRDAIQVGNVVCFLPADPGGGGYWSPTENWISDVNVPTGNAGVFFKGRLWAVPGPNPANAWSTSTKPEESRLRFTEPITFDISASNKPEWKKTDSEGLLTNQIDVSRGDGQDLVDIVIYQDQLMLFKTDSTYVLAYETTIDQGILQCIHTQVGATTRVCVAVWEDFVYVLHQGNVYEIKNYDFEQINVKVPFVIDNFIPTIDSVPQARENNATICVIEDRLVVRYFNRIYLFGLLTRSWSRWESGNDPVTGFKEQHLQNMGYFRPFPTDTLRNKPTYYYAGSVLRDQPDVFEWVEGRFVDVFETYDGPTRLDINCEVLTKHIDVDDPYNFKKLAWWGVDVISGKNVQASAIPVVVFWRRTWDSISNIPWMLLETWDHLTDIPYHEDTHVVDTTVVERKFIKLNKALRFRQIYFRLTLHSDGSLMDGPARLFKIIPWIGQKQQVVKQVS